MITHCTTKKWGNSLGVRLPVEVVRQLELHPEQDITITIQIKQPVLKELFGFAKDNPITRKDVEEVRSLMEGRY